MENSRGLMVQVAVVAMLLMFLVGSVSAKDCGDGVATCECSDNVVADWTFTGDLTCATGYGLKIGAEGITIDGAGYALDGVAATGCTDWTDDYDAGHRGIVASKHDNIVIKNLEIRNFCKGIYFKGTTADPCSDCLIDDCEVHHNGDSSVATNDMGMFLINFDHSTIRDCKVHHNDGAGTGCQDGGNGIFIYGPTADYNIITENEFYDNRKSGFFTKMKCDHTTISHNKAYRNDQAGINLRCKLSNDHIIEHNNVHDNYGDGIFIGGNHNTIRDNVVKDNTAGFKISSSDVVGDGDGIDMGRSSESNNNELYENEVCGNEGTDIEVTSGCTGNHGDDNTCDTTKNYGDGGTTGCVNSCGGSATTTSSSTSSTTTTSLAATTTSISAGTGTTTTSIQGPTSSTTTIDAGTTITASTVAVPSQLLSVSAPAEVSPPEEFKVEIKLSGKKVLGASFSLLFNQEVIKAMKVEEGDFFKNCPGTTFSAIPAEINNARGEIKFQDMCLGSTMSGEGVVAEIRFSVKSLGDPEINLENVQLFDEEGDPMSEDMIEVRNSEMQEVEVDTTTSTPTSVSSSTTSVPATTMATRAHETKTAESNPSGVVGDAVGFSAENGSWILGTLIVMGIVFYVGYSRGNNNRGNKGGGAGGVSLWKQS